MTHSKDKDAYSHKKFDLSFYVHKKFGGIKLEEPRKRKAEVLEVNNYRSYVEILDVIVINAPKRTKLAEIARPANAFTNNQNKGREETSTAAEVYGQRKTKKVKIAPQRLKIQQSSTTSTPSSRCPGNINVNAKSREIKAQLTQSPASVSIAPITIATMPLTPQIASVLHDTKTAPSTIAKSSSPFPPASTIGYFNQTSPLSPIYGLPNSYLKPVPPSNFDTYYGRYNAQPTMPLNFATTATTTQCQPPMFYTHLLQRQMHAMTQRQSAVGKRQVSTAV